MDKTVYIIILNYNNYKDTIECVNSVIDIEYENIKILIVDNNSTNDSYKKLKEEFNNKVILIKSKKNLGYAGGNNLGIKYALDNNADYICILNNDTLVPKTFLTRMIPFMEQNGEFAIVGPTILYDNIDNLVQSTGAKIDMIRGKTPSINRGKKYCEIKQKIINCDYIGGACILLRSEVIKKIGYIPENYFLFYEETEWCYNAKKKGFPVICYTNEYIIHKGGKSIVKIGGLNEYIKERNRVVFVKRNADFFILILFYIYLVSKTIIRFIFFKGSLYYLKYYFDGTFNLIDKKYSFIYLNNNK